MPPDETVNLNVNAPPDVPTQEAELSDEALIAEYGKLARERTGEAPLETKADAEKPEEPKPEEPTEDPELAEFRRKRDEAKARWQQKSEEGRWKRTAAEREQRAEALARENEAARRELAELRRAITEDPLGLIDKLGITADQLAERVMKRGTPEELEERATKKAERTAQEIAERIVGEKMKQLEEKERSIESRKAAQEFVATYKASADKYEALSALYEPEEVLQKAWDLAAQAHSQGITATDEQLLEYLEHQERARYIRVQERQKAKQTPSTDTTAPGQKPAGIKREPEAPRTLTNSLNASRSSTGVAVEDLPKEEQDEYWRTEIRKQLAGSR